MKSDDDRILKYISELMDSKERNQFENELAASDDLKKQFESFSHVLNGLNHTKEMDLDERYFVNLIPRVKERIEKRKKVLSLRNVYFITPSMAAVTVLVIFLFSSKAEFDKQYKDLASQVVNNFSDSDVSEQFFAELATSPADEILTQSSDQLNIQIPSELEIKNDSYSRLVDNPNTEELSTLNRLSESELEIVFQKLNSSTSQKVIK